MTVEQLLTSISSRELSEWIAYFDTEPPEEHGYRQAGIVASTIANVNKEKGSKAFKAEDFMPTRGAEIVEQSPDQLRANMLAYAKRSGRKKKARPDGNTGKAVRATRSGSKEIQPGD